MFANSLKYNYYRTSKSKTALVVQWIELLTPNERIEVRFLSRAPTLTHDKQLTTNNKIKIEFFKKYVIIFIHWAYGEMVSHIHGMDGAGVRFSLGPQ